jgi:pantoate--beta-alanine ligase
MEILRTVEHVRQWRSTSSAPLALVPTMGSLHLGHLSLIDLALKSAPSVMMSLFVNPTQFNHSSDYDLYPRDVERDLDLARDAGCHACFLPSIEEVYPTGAQTQVTMGPLADHLCGAKRPGHFDGVCTVVSALFNITQCGLAVFGEKDFQQLAIIRRLVIDLHFPVKIIGAPTVRERDGLAMSSRNIRLNSSQRAQASLLYSGLETVHRSWMRGERGSDQLKQIFIDSLPKEITVDYVELCAPSSLTIFKGRCEESTLIAVACFLGEVRLIDHLNLSHPLPSLN